MNSAGIEPKPKLEGFEKARRGFGASAGLELDFD
jgi:hypothetical protein